MKDQGRRCARKRVARLMHELGLTARRPTHRTITTKSEKGAEARGKPAPARLQCRATQHAHGSRIRPPFGRAEGWLYLAIVLVLFSRMVVGWSMAAIQDAMLALARTAHGFGSSPSGSAGVLHHSDRGSTYTSESYQAILQHAGSDVSMSRTGNCSENAAMESFFHSFKGECVDRERFRTRTQAKLATFEYSECFYNRTRRHSTLNSMSPIAYEQVMRYISTLESPQKRVKITAQSGIILLCGQSMH